MSERKNKILLLGFGRYGEQIAKNLALEGYEIFIAEESKDALKIASNDGFENLFVIDIQSDQQLTELVLEYGFERVFCAFDEEEKNIYLTITMKALFRNIEVIALCESKESERKLLLAGANKVIDTMVAAANRLYFVLEKPAVAEAIDNILYKDKSLIFKEVEVPVGSFLDGKNIKEINFSRDFRIIVIGIVDIELGRKFTFLTKGINHKIDAGDILVVIGKKWDIEKFEEELKKVNQ
ncbi:potassium channel family protein [Nitratiruptor tergarcus]|uniref:Trk K+ transport system, NAD-binding component n=1 Tax=Nitratiruptor tergarcus DSM 16512 TaxID=1069081 RepID=A0A1W1WU83_9BACT|nr:NAD-binding protein [Nitratiruptor tergarcus]SMC09762.1 Trk K+ transport system, NAD-binding component [Nitratiruptor tergarcus DSM 16512]